CARVTTVVYFDYW
nr:immunoglobulin heavy chain junction region [Mus musculus]